MVPTVPQITNGILLFARGVPLFSGARDANNIRNILTGERFLKMVCDLRFLRVFRLASAILAVSGAPAADFRPPAGDSYALVTASGTVLPGGRFLRPFGIRIETGPGSFGLAVSPGGTIATADTGYERFGITLIEPLGRNPWRVQHIWARTPHGTAPERADPDWKGVAAGIVFDSPKTIWVSEGDSGRIRQIDTATGDHRKIVNLNSSESDGSYTADLAYDGVHRILYAVDQSNARVVLVDGRTGRILSSVRLSGTPSAIALSPDGYTAYVTEPKSVCAIDVRNALKPEVTDRIESASPQAVLATADRIFVSNALDDSITVISTGDRKVVAEISLVIPSLEQFRGVMPAGLAYDPVTKWLLVAETGINAIGIVDTAKNQLIGHIPTDWMPTRVAIAGDRVYVTNARGRGTGPNPRRTILELGEVPVLHRGSVTTFIMPDANEILRHTGAVFSMNGFVPNMRDVPKPPAAIRRVVLIVKENRTFDEVMGDVVKAGNGPVLSSGKLARFGMHGGAMGGRSQFSVQDAPITPNQHEIARRWAFSDNFYADSNTKAEGDAWLQSVRLRDHLQRGGVQFQNLDEGSGTETSDQSRVDRFIAELDGRYGKGGEPFPQFLSIHLPNDRTGDPRPRNGYPYDASFVADNDLATGRILDYLSHSPWWLDMAVFITESDTQGSLDHIDAHRTLLFAAGPYVKRNYVSHINSSFPGLLRTIFEVLGLPPSSLLDATAASLLDMFTGEPDFTPFTASQPDGRIFDPARLSTR
jgi:DNA-binding beta-propeller fold protein YncE